MRKQAVSISGARRRQRIGDDCRLPSGGLFRRCRVHSSAARARSSSSGGRRSSDNHVLLERVVGDPDAIFKQDLRVVPVQPPRLLQLDFDQR